MNFANYLINKRPLSAFYPLSKEFTLETNKNYLFDLSYLTALNVIGERAEEFLQGQISCDVRLVSASQIQQGALCNLKGRILALFDVIKWNNLQLILAKDLLASTQYSLNKTALLSRVKLEPEVSGQIFGFYLNNSKDLLPNPISLPATDFAFDSTMQNCCYRLTNDFYIILIKKEYIQSLIQPFIEQQQIRGSLAWHQLQLWQKNIQIYPETRSLFLPHRLNLHLSGYLNFDKGCYKGQEIIARTHYRATLKHTLKLFVIETNEPIKSGEKLFIPHSETEMGELIDYCPIADNCYLVAASILYEHPDHALIESHNKLVFLKSP